MHGIYTFTFRVLGDRWGNLVHIIAGSIAEARAQAAREARLLRVPLWSLRLARVRSWRSR